MKEIDLKRTYNNVLSQTISTSKKFLFAGNLFGDIFIVNLSDLENSADGPPSNVKVFSEGSEVHMNCLSFHRDFLIVGGIGIIYGLKWNEEEQTLSSKRDWEIKIPLSVDAVEVPDVNSFYLSAESDTLYAGCGDGVIYQIDLENGSIVREYRGHKDYVHSVVGNSNGRIFSSAEDGAVRAWSINQKQETLVLEPHLNNKLFRPDWGKWIGAVAVNDDWLVCGGGPRPAIFHLKSLQCTRIFDFPGRVHLTEFVDDSVFIGGEYSDVISYTLNGSLQSSISVENTTTYSAVWQMNPFKFMSIAGFSNKLHILKDFKFLDSKIELYTKPQDTDEESDEDSNVDEDASF